MNRAWAMAAVMIVAGASHADDWPGYRGPARNDVSMEKGLLKEWPAGGPKLLWTYAQTGVGLSGPAVVGDRLYILGDREDSAFLIALDLKSAKDGTVSEAWATRLGANFNWTGNHWSAGPSAAPTVDGELVYGVSGSGDLICAESATGKERWRKSFPTDLAGEVNPIGGGPKKLGWGYTASPLADGDQLVCIVGGPQGTVAALKKRTGAVIWRSVDLKDQAAYTSAQVTEIAGVRQYIVLTNQGLAGVDAKDGKLLWLYRRPRPYGTEVVNSPLIQGPLIYVTVGGQGCEFVRITGEGGAFKATPVYENKNLSNHHGGVVLLDGHVYGHSGREWVCQKLENGEIAASLKQRMGSGSITYADGRFYCLAEGDGTVALMEAGPAGWTERGRFKLPKQSSMRKKNGKIWTPPVVSNGRLYLRDQELLFCYDVSSGK